MSDNPELKEINQKLDLILLKIEKIENSCNKMDSHINFIEKVCSSPFRLLFGRSLPLLSSQNS